MILDIIYEGLYTARIITGLALFAKIYLSKKFRLPVAAVIVIALALIVIGASYYPILCAIVDSGMDIAVLRAINVVWYICLVGLIFGAFVLCFKANICEYAFLIALACLTECALFGFMRLFVDVGVFELRVNTILSLFLEITFSIAYYIGIYFLFSKFAKNKPQGEYLSQKHMTVLFLLTLALNMFLRFALQYIYEFMYGNPYSWIVNLILGLIPVFLLVLNMLLVAARYSRVEQVRLGTILSERERQYAANYSNMEIIRRQVHDMKHLIQAFKDPSVKDNGVVEEIEQAISFYDAVVSTVNPSLNTLLSEKSLYCASHGIRLTMLPDAEAISFMSPIDIYIMFGNLLDNAIEAVEKISDADKRLISFTMKRENDMICIQTNNYYDEKLTLKDGLPATTKTDNGIHGYGIRSIMLTVQKYGGIFNVGVDDDIFIASITIPLTKNSN